MNTLAFGMPSPAETIVIIFVILLLFGSKKLPELARSLGRSLNEFKRGQTESLPEQKEEAPKEPAAAPAPEEEKPEEPKADA
ncbi:MAG: twin-arginine translocase TatA/TatE family subunit [Kiritimatiellales bacterium]|nr:twin-arginine translocase TatA/TatE family subunit [Kiritimatiellales bacterium]